MLTPLNIMSCDQGREFARQEMKRLYAEPKQPALETIAADISADDVRSQQAASRPTWRLLFAEFIGLWHTGYPIGVRDTRL